MMNELEYELPRLLRPGEGVTMSSKVRTWRRGGITIATGESVRLHNGSEMPVYVVAPQPGARELGVSWLGIEGLLVLILLPWILLHVIWGRWLEATEGEICEEAFGIIY